MAHDSRSSWSRRAFVSATAVAPVALRAAARVWRVAILGHTGRGNYGHGLDIAFRGVENAEVVAVADPVEEGRAKALARSGAPRGYADYREMLRREQVDIAVIGPRWLDQRVAMVHSATTAGAHLLMEKAFAATLEDADVMMRAIGAERCKRATRHGRLQPRWRRSG